jgi:hypothetical protein
VGALDLVGERLADVVQEPAALGELHVHPQLGGHDAGQVRGLDEVAQHVLAVGGAVLEPAEHAHQLGVEVGDADLQAGVLAGAADLALHLLPGAVVGLLDAGGVDAAVGDQLLQGEAADLAPHRVEAGQQHRLGGVVDDQVDPGDGLEGADVAALAADDPALHVVGGQRQHRHGRLRGLLGGDPLDGEGDDLAGAAVGLLPRLLLEVPDQTHGVALGVLLDLLDQDRLGLAGGHGRDLLQPAPVLVGGGLQLLPGRLDGLLAVVEGRLAPVEQGDLGLHALLLGDHPLLAPLQLGQARAALNVHLSSKLGGLGLDRLPQPQRLVARLDGGLSAGGLGLPLGVLQDRAGLALRGAEQGGRLFALVGRADDEAEHDPDEGSDDDESGLHRGLLYDPSGRVDPTGVSHPTTRPAVCARNGSSAERPPGAAQRPCDYGPKVESDGTVERVALSLEQEGPVNSRCTKVT